MLLLLLEAPSDDSVEMAVDFLKEAGPLLLDLTPSGLQSIMDRLRWVEVVGWWGGGVGGAEGDGAGWAGQGRASATVGSFLWVAGGWLVGRAGLVVYGFSGKRGVAAAVRSIAAPLPPCH